MGFRDEDKILIKNVHDSKSYRGCGAKQATESFLNRLEQKWTVMQHRVYQRQIHSIECMNWNGSSSMCMWCGLGAVSRFLTRLVMTSGEEDLERVCVIKEDTSSTACELAMSTLSISVTFNVTCLTVASLITKSCQQRWPIRSCSFYKVVH